MQCGVIFVQAHNEGNGDNVTPFTAQQSGQAVRQNSSAVPSQAVDLSNFKVRFDVPAMLHALWCVDRHVVMWRLVNEWPVDSTFPEGPQSNNIHRCPFA